MKRYKLVNLIENCRLVADVSGDWMKVAEHKALTAKYRDALERIVINEHDCRGCLLDVSIAKEALGI